MIITSSPSEVDENFLCEKLNEYNDCYREKDGKRISIYIKDENGNISAGLSGVTFLTWLQVDILWVSEVKRRNNMGSRLLASAESVALERGCSGVYVETYSYQSLGFYIKQGYVEFGCLKGYGPHSRHFLKKIL